MNSPYLLDKALRGAQVAQEHFGDGAASCGSLATACLRRQPRCLVVLVRLDLLFPDLLAPFATQESPAAPYYNLEGPLLKPPGAGTDENPFVMRLPPLFIPTRMTDAGDGSSHVFMELPLHHSVSYLKAAAPRAIARRWTVNGPQGPTYEFETMCHLKGTWMPIELPSWENVQVLLQEMAIPNPSLGHVVLRMQLNVRLPTAEAPPHEYTHYTYHYVLDLDRDTPVPQPVKMEHVPVTRKRQRRK